MKWCDVRNPFISCRIVSFFKLVVPSDIIPVGIPNAMHQSNSSLAAVAVVVDGTGKTNCIRYDCHGPLKCTYPQFYLSPSQCSHIFKDLEVSFLDIRTERRERVSPHVVERPWIYDLKRIQCPLLM